MRRTISGPVERESMIHILRDGLFSSQFSFAAQAARKLPESPLVIVKARTSSSSPKARSQSATLGQAL